GEGFNHKFPTARCGPGSIRRPAPISSMMKLLPLTWSLRHDGRHFPRSQARPAAAFGDSYTQTKAAYRTPPAVAVSPAPRRPRDTRHLLGSGIQDRVGR